MDRLRANIRNLIFHNVGVHTRCDTYFCNKTEKDNDYTKLNILKANETVYNSAIRCIESVAIDADQLCMGLETNKAENAFSALAKKVGGKRVNMSNLGSYKRRFNLMVLEKNGGYPAIRKLFEQFTGSEPGATFEVLLENRVKQLAWTAKSKARSNFVRSSKIGIKHGADSGYGIESVQRNRQVSQEEIEEKRATYQVRI